MDSKRHWINGLFTSVVPGVAQDAHQRIGEMVAETHLIREVRDGNPDAHRALYLGFVGFVSKFPNGIREYVERELTRKRFETAFGRDARVLVPHFARAMSQLAQEEGNHHKAWIKAASSRKISGEELAVKGALQAPSTQLVAQAFEGNPLQVMMRLAATESVATWLSIHFLSSEKFLKLYSGEDLEWFIWHALPHDGPSHQKMQLYLASTLLRVVVGNDFVPLVWSEMVGFAEAFQATANKVIG